MFDWLSGKTAGTAVSQIADTIDDFFHTDQEKAAGREKIFALQVEMAKATAPQNLARRIIACAITGVWVFFLVLAVLCWWFAPGYSEFIFRIMAENVNQPFTVVVAFYFASHIVGKLKGK